MSVLCSVVGVSRVQAVPQTHVPPACATHPTDQPDALQLRGGTE